MFSLKFGSTIKADHAERTDGKQQSGSRFWDRGREEAVLVSAGINEIPHDLAGVVDPRDKSIERAWDIEGREDAPTEKEAAVSLAIQE